MLRETRRKIREIMRSQIRCFYDHGYRPRTADLAALIQSDHPELVAELQPLFTTRALQELAVEVARTRRSVVEKDQLVLPGMDKDLLERLPPALAIPVNGCSHDTVLVPADAATLVEWTAYLNHLRSQHRGLVMVISAIQEAIERAVEAGCPSEAPLLPWLSKQASTAAG